MNRKNLVISLIAIAVFAFAVTGFAADKPSVAILDFETVGSEEHLGKAVAEIMRTELIDTNKFRVVERAQINKALSEQRFQRSGVTDEKSATEIGKLLGADLIIIGSVVKIGSSYTINSRMIDIKTGEATLGKNVTGSDLNLLTNLSRTLIDRLFGRPQKDVELPANAMATEKQPVISSGSISGQYQWQSAGIGDCPGRDVYPLSIGSAIPSSELCNADFIGKIAVCWDGSSMKHYGSTNPQCTFRDVSAKHCSGGKSPGYIFECIYNTGPETRTGAVNWGNGKAYFFRGNKYIRYDIASNRADPGYPKPFNAQTWPGLMWTDGIDAAVNWGNGKAYFFKGSQYVRYDIAADRVDSGYPQPINDQTWPGLTWTNGIDAAVNWGNGKAYFFKGNQYIRYDIQHDRVDLGYPKPINAQTWPDMIWTDGIDDAVMWNNNKVFFFKGNQFIRYDIAADRADPGYPKPIDNRTWPGLLW